MTDDELLAFIRNRIKTIELCGLRADVKDVRWGPLGFYRPPNKIELLLGRTPQETLFTLLHEFGHFWSFAVKRRPSELPLDSDIWRKWIKDTSDRTFERFKDRYVSSDRVPIEEWKPAFAEESAKDPIPLDERRRRQILEEEERAWTFAYAAAEALDLAPHILKALIDATRRSLAYYWEALGFSPDPNWTPKVANLCLSPLDRSYISELSRPG